MFNQNILQTPFILFPSSYAFFLSFSKTYLKPRGPFLKNFYLLYLRSCSIFFVTLTIYSIPPFTLSFVFICMSPSSLSFLSLLNPYLCLIIKLFSSYPLLPSLFFPSPLPRSLPQFYSSHHAFPSCLPSIVSSVEVALLIGISICGICSFSRSPALPLSFSPPLSPRSVCAWPDAAWQVLRPTSIFHINTTHTQNCAYTHTAAFPKCLCTGRTGAEGGDGREEYKNNFSFPLPPFLASVILHAVETLTNAIPPRNPDPFSM